jgi:hypothetical protein
MKSPTANLVKWSTVKSPMIKPAKQFFFSSQPGKGGGGSTVKPTSGHINKLHGSDVSQNECVGLETVNCVMGSSQWGQGNQGNVTVPGLGGQGSWSGQGTQSFNLQPNEDPFVLADIDDLGLGHLGNNANQNSSSALFQNPLGGIALPRGGVDKRIYLAALLATFAQTLTPPPGDPSSSRDQSTQSNNRPKPPNLIQAAVRGAISAITGYLAGTAAYVLESGDTDPLNNPVHVVGNVIKYGIYGAIVGVVNEVVDYGSAMLFPDRPGYYQNVMAGTANTMFNGVAASWFSMLNHEDMEDGMTNFTGAIISTPANYIGRQFGSHYAGIVLSSAIDAFTNYQTYANDN